MNHKIVAEALPIFGCSLLLEPPPKNKTSSYGEAAMACAPTSSWAERTGGGTFWVWHAMALTGGLTGEWLGIVGIRFID